MKTFDTIIIGASAAGLMCAIEAGKRNRHVTVLDHANKAGKKILMSGGGRCNFTNYHVSPDNYRSHNPHFCKSALNRFTQWDFIDLVEKKGIPFHEKTLGQLFCNNKAHDILNMLLHLCHRHNVNITLKIKIINIQKIKSGYQLHTTQGLYLCQSLVIATGGLSIPTMGATGFGYDIAKQFGHHVWPTSAALVPFTLQPKDKMTVAPLSGMSVNTIITSHNHQSFHENMLLTHRGLSGPAILQISSYWRQGESISINLLPHIDLNTRLLSSAKHNANTLKSILTPALPKRLLSALFNDTLLHTPLSNISRVQRHHIIAQLHSWEIKPSGTEGYRTAEVTLGGVDCNEISSKTFESNKTKGLYFIGEVLDVTGWLGGYNFQWAWSSGWCAGQVV